MRKNTTNRYITVQDIADNEVNNSASLDVNSLSETANQQAIRSVRKSKRMNATNRSITVQDITENGSSNSASIGIRSPNETGNNPIKLIRNGRSRKRVASNIYADITNEATENMVTENGMEDIVMLVKKKRKNNDGTISYNLTDENIDNLTFAPNIESTRCMVENSPALSVPNFRNSSNIVTSTPVSRRVVSFSNPIEESMSSSAKRMKIRPLREAKQSTIEALEKMQKKNTFEQVLDNMVDERIDQEVRGEFELFLNLHIAKANFFCLFYYFSIVIVLSNISF